MDNLWHEEELKQVLKKRVLGLKEGYRQNLALIGSEAVGKTTLACKVISELNDKEIIPVFIRARKESPESFILRFLGTLLYAFLKTRGPETELNQDLNHLIRAAEGLIPKTLIGIKNIQKNLEKRKYDELFNELLSLSDILFEESAKYILIIFDEFDLLEKMPIKNLYREWAKKIILQKNTMYILISSAKFKAKQILSEKLSLLFGNFETIEFDSLEQLSAEKLVNQIMAPLTLERPNINFLINFTAAHPFYIQLISSTLKDYLKLQNSDRPQSEYIIEALGHLLFDKWGILNQRFNALLNGVVDSDKKSYDFISILIAISDGNSKIKDLMHITHKPRKDLNINLNKLIEKDVIIRNGDFFKISDVLFSFWLKYVYQEKLKSLDFNRNIQIKKFEETIRHLIKDFMSASQKTIFDRLLELLSLFDDEAIQLNKSKIKLSHFREIKPINLERKNMDLAIIARASDFLWILAIKKGIIEEKDVVDFSQECKKYRSRSQYKILITLQDIDINAKLLAREEKILTWNTSNLNALLDLYNKPRLLL